MRVFEVPFFYNCKYHLKDMFITEGHIKYYTEECKLHIYNCREKKSSDKIYYERKIFL